MTKSAAMRPTRHFLCLPGRRVHYVRAGDGPPAVLIHSSPANARLLMKEIDRLSTDFTVFAFDTPGFGLSDPLPLSTMEVADLADALAETLAALGMPPCPVFGTHTGAAIALELGVRHPSVATGLVLDGVPVFTDEECARYFRDYFRKLPATDLGGHYAEAWTRFRDQAVWFPWCEREPENLNAYDPGPAHSTHLWVSMYFEAADTYEPAYRAASFYGEKAIAAAGALTLPVTYVATETDMLHPHLSRLPPLKADQEIRSIGASYERKRTLIAERFAAYGAGGPAPPDRDAIGPSDALARQFVGGGAGQIHLRWKGSRDAPPVLLLHDAPGSGEQLVPLLDRLGASFFALAPDLPGHGESDGFADQPDISALARTTIALLDRLALPQVAILGFGFGSSVALELARLEPGRVTRVGLCSVALPDPAERDWLRANYTPPVTIEPDGGHWYRTWLMLRDSQVYWPWFDRRFDSLRRVDADFSAAPMHRWTMDVMRARDTYHHLVQAALAHDATAALESLSVPLFLAHGGPSPLATYDPALATLRPDAAWIDAADRDALVGALSPPCPGAEPR